MSSSTMALPDDELDLISKKLTFEPDYTRFRSVCKSWRSAAPKRPQLPWVISYHRIDSAINTTFLNFYQFSFETNKIARISELSDLPISSSFLDNSTVYIGSSHGWLAFFNHKTSFVSLFNPLTDSHIDLPKLQNPNLNEYAFNHSYGHSFSFNLTSDPGESLSNCFALIFCSERIFYCKLGSGDWIEMSHPNIEYSDIHFYSYHGKVFFTLYGDAFVCDFGPDPSVCMIVSISLKDLGTSEIEFIESFLVELEGNLLMVLLYYIEYLEDLDDDIYFQIFKLDFQCQQVKLVELKSLGGKSLFLGMKNPFSLTANRYPGCKENSIYNAWVEYDPEEQRDIQHLRIYDFDRLSYVVIKDDDVSLHNNSKLYDWFAPSLLN